MRALDRAYHANLDSGEGVRAVRCAFWLGLRLFLRGETGHATGWLARAQRLLEREEHDCVEQGYLLLPSVEQHLAAGNCEAWVIVDGRLYLHYDKEARDDTAAAPKTRIAAAAERWEALGKSP